jgi:shikimate kinase
MSLPIYLIGARGCGKTTVGQALSQALGYAFNDTDHHLQLSTQRSVAEIVASEGWESFRARETESLRAVTAPNTVIATGGGMILAEANCRFMREHGQVIWLNAPSDVRYSARACASLSSNGASRSQRHAITRSRGGTNTAVAFARPRQLNPQISLSFFAAILRCLY